MILKHHVLDAHRMTSRATLNVQHGTVVMAVTNGAVHGALCSGRKGICNRASIGFTDAILLMVPKLIEHLYYTHGDGVRHGVCQFFSPPTDTDCGVMGIHVPG